jgi:hypothetical protein
MWINGIWECDDEPLDFPSWLSSHFPLSNYDIPILWAVILRNHRRDGVCYDWSEL